MKRYILLTLCFALTACTKNYQDQVSITNFEECVSAGNAVMESYPRQCRTPDGKHFIEDIKKSMPDSYGSASDSAELTHCTQDAKQCSDGSYVSRQGPNCEFAPCP